MEPIRLLPSCKNYIWGGENLKKYWNKLSDSDKIAETWELSCHPEGECMVSGMNKSLSNYIKENPSATGTDCLEFDNFPILIKLIDSKQNLSIQVHPNDEYALEKEKQYGKTEMWYIVSAEKGAGVYCGFKNSIEKSEIKKHLENGTICDVLNFIEVEEGDCLFIEAGTVHAICGGLIICEVQQNSSLTYRLYDYDRVDNSGNKRELHIEKSLDVINGDMVSERNSSIKQLADNYKQLAKCKYFTAFEITGKEFKDAVDSKSFVALNFLSDAKLTYKDKIMSVNKGDTYFLPADMGDYTLSGDNLKVIKTIV